MNIDTLLDISTSIPGWTAGTEARRLVSVALNLKDNATIAEVGVFMGRCTFLLASSRRESGSGVVYCIDSFDCSGDEFSIPYYLEILEDSGMPTLFDAFYHNIKKHGLENWIKIHEGDACEIASQWSEPLDLLLLDADQSPEKALKTYKAWEPFLKTWGTIVLCNTADRVYAKGHDGYRRIAIEKIVFPKYCQVRRVGGLTFARKEF